jgi:transketolase N-terminal domain/subunit
MRSRKALQIKDSSSYRTARKRQAAARNSSLSHTDLLAANYAKAKTILAAALPATRRRCTVPARGRELLRHFYSRLIDSMITGSTGTSE